MPAAFKLMGFLLIFIFSLCCTASKDGYSYNTVTYVIGQSKQPLYYDNLITYGDYLFEFRRVKSVRTTMHGDSSGATSIDYDTVGVYLLLGTQRLFYEFDSFALNGRIIQVGKLEDRPDGQKISFSNKGTNSHSSYGPLKKVVINNISCFITGVIPENKTGVDSITQKVLLLKNPTFNSLFKLSGIKYPDSNYCIVGFQMYDSKHKESLNQEIESMRPLSRKEKEVCANMIKASKFYVVDTLKNRNL